MGALRRSASEDCHRCAENPCFGRLEAIARLEGAKSHILTTIFSSARFC